jgi:hypothetical protein
MAKTTFASRIATLRIRAESEHKRSESNLAVWIGALYELLGIRRISRIQIAWCRTRIIAIRDKYPDDLRVQKMLEDLDRRADEAWDRHLKRIAKRQEAKTIKGDSASSPAEASASTPAVLPASPVELWKEMLAKQQQEQQEKRT